MNSCSIACSDLLDLGALRSCSPLVISTDGRIASTTPSAAIVVVEAKAVETSPVLANFDTLAPTPLGILISNLPFEPRFAFSIALGLVLEESTEVHCQFDCSIVPCSNNVT